MTLAFPRHRQQSDPPTLVVTSINFDFLVIFRSTKLSAGVVHWQSKGWGYEDLQGIEPKSFCALASRGLGGGMATHGVEGHSERPGGALLLLKHVLVLGFLGHPAQWRTALQCLRSHPSSIVSAEMQKTIARGKCQR